jgi:quercetin dioxygenase-like cupin family protein
MAAWRLTACVLLVSGCVESIEPDCALPAGGVVLRDADSTVMVSPLFAGAQVDSLGLYAGRILLLPEAAVAEHAHADAEELVFVTCGGGEMILDGVEHVLETGTSLRIPRDAQHTVMAGPRGLLAVQVYRPGGPGKRFYDWAAMLGER